MKRSVSISILFGGLSLIALTGCAGGYSSGYYAYVPPPAPRYGVLGYAPAPGYVWTDGYYVYGRGRYNWVPGRWARPPRGHSEWVPGRWNHDGRGYRFHRGYWR
jgi:hypothetical protein